MAGDSVASRWSWNVPPRHLLRRSEPVQHTQQLDPSCKASLTNRIQSMYGVITAFDHGVGKQSDLETPVSQSSLGDSPSQKVSRQFSKVELADDASSIDSGVKPAAQQCRKWRPSYFRLGPLIGLASLALAFLQLFASYAVLRSSDGRPVDGWKYHPPVYIAIFTALSNGLISLAAVKGAVITFWLRCLSGTTLGQMHRDWSYSFETYNALRSGKNVNMLAVACIFATLVCIDGPLLQRATFTQVVNSHSRVELNVSVVPEIPSYFTGVYNAAQYGFQFSNAMLPVMNEYSSDAPIKGGINGCTGICTTTIRAPALVADHCGWHTTQHNFSTPWTHKEKAVYNGESFPTTRMLFASYLSSTYGDSETLDFETYLIENEVADTCAGPVNTTHCYLRSAIAEYDVTITNGTITLNDPGNPTFVSWANNTAITNKTIHNFDLRDNQSPGTIRTTLAAIVNAFVFKYSFTGYAYPPEHSKPGTLDISVQSQSLFMYQHITNYIAYNNQDACTYTWSDPRPATMAGLNELMFRIGVHVAQNYNSTYLTPLLDAGVETNYTVPGTLHGPQEVFKSDFRWYYGAAALELLTILLVAATFFGYWRLGRHVSFSPLEIAKAFDAPLLQGVEENLSGRGITRLRGSQAVRYGVVFGKGEVEGGQGGKGTLKMWHPKEVNAPERQSSTAPERCGDMI